MIILKQLYGDKLYSPKLPRYVGYAPYVIHFILQMILAWGVVKIFDVSWDYAFIKVFVLIELFGFLRFLVNFYYKKFIYLIIGKKLFTSQMKHYMKLFSKDVNWDDIGCYEDFLLEAAFSKTLPDDMKVLAAMNYASFIDSMNRDPMIDGRAYKIYSDIVDDFVPWAN